MKRLLKIKPFVFLIGIVGLFTILILLLKMWIRIVPDNLKPYGIMILLIGFSIYFFFWIYLLGYGFNELNKKTGNLLEIRKFGFATLLAFFSSISGYFLNFYFLFEKNGEQKPEYLTIPLGLLFLYGFIFIIIKLTNYYRFYDRKSEPSFIDYVVTAFLICFFPFGLLIMHTHLRSILKEGQILE